MRPKILLIEDDQPTIDIYKEILRRADFEVEILNWGRQGLDRLKEIKEGKKERPDLILLDLILPDINGIKVLEKAKKDGTLKDIPFFVLTNYTDPRLEKESRELGVEKYIIKTNYIPSQLVKTIRNYLSGK